MKTSYIFILFLVLSTLFTSCKKEIEPETTPTSTDENRPVVFTANVNFVDEGAAITMNGVSDYPTYASPTPETAGDISQDSILRLYFEDKSTNTVFTLLLSENGGDIIQPGTYSLTSSGAEYLLSMQIENKQSDILYSYMNSLNGLGFEYNGQPVTSSGVITITSFEQNSISGTINAELYYHQSSFLEKTHKAIITNGSFNCDIVRN